MTDVKLSEQDKADLLKFLDDYSKRVSEVDINEIETKLLKKISKLRNKKLPNYTKKMISQVKDLSLILDSPTVSEDEHKKIIAALHYFIWAEDKMPDYLPVVGYLDDAFIIATVYSEVRNKINKFKKARR